MMSTGQKVQSTLIKPAVAGALAGGFAAWYYPNGYATVYGYRMPEWALIAGAVAGSTFVGTAAGNWLLPQVLPSGGGQLAQLTTAALNPTLAALTTVLTAEILSPDGYAASGGFVPLSLIGAGSFVGADFITNKFLSSNNGNLFN
jgi:hypothetical protein